MDRRNILLTGGAGFIGSHLIKRLMNGTEQLRIVSVDSVNPYYDVYLKEWRLQELSKIVSKNQDVDYIFLNVNIADKELVKEVFENYHPDIVVNLAAQAGTRASIEHPDDYIESNIIGFYNILEACRHSAVSHLIFASSSSVYGDNSNIPFSTNDMTDHPVSLYAATKKSDELLAYSYSKLYNIPTTGLRFFTVYGPAGRPDMAYFSFAEKLVQGESIRIFNYGDCKRDFTYIDDIVEGIVRVMNNPPKAETIPPYRIYNIGKGHPDSLMDFVRILQEELISTGLLSSDYDLDAHMELLPMQPGDVSITYADTSDFEKDFGFRPETDLRTGLKRFVEWYRGWIDKERYGN